jgi:coatomer subunit beta'
MYVPPVICTHQRKKTNICVQKKLFSRSDRVKGVDFHPTEPWLLTGLYKGTVNIYNHETGVKTFEVAEVPVRCRVFNYNTYEKVVAFGAHPDYIRCLTVHPTLSIVLTGSDDMYGSDDMTIKAWDWDKAWKNIQVSHGFQYLEVCLLNFMNRHTKAIHIIS